MRDKNLPMEISSDVINTSMPRKIKRYVSKTNLVMKKDEKTLEKEFYGYRPGMSQNLLKRSDFDV